MEGDLRTQGSIKGEEGERVRGGGGGGVAGAVVRGGEGVEGKEKREGLKGKGEGEVMGEGEGEDGEEEVVGKEGEENVFFSMTSQNLTHPLGTFTLHIATSPSSSLFPSSTPSFPSTSNSGISTQLSFSPSPFCPACSLPLIYVSVYIFENFFVPCKEMRERGEGEGGRGGGKRESTWLGRRGSKWGREGEKRMVFPV